MKALAVDSWAFLEMSRAGPRADETSEVLESAEFAFTTRDVVTETFDHIARRTGGTRIALAWWDELREGDVRVFEPPMDELHAFITLHGRRGALSFTDLSLAFAAKREDVREVLTEDAEFRRIGLEPLFAKR